MNAVDIPTNPSPKTMARALRAALIERRIAITHSDALELVARQFGYENWNVLAARTSGLAVASEPAEGTDNGSTPDGWFVHEAGRRGLFRHDLLEAGGESGASAILIESRLTTTEAVAGDFLTVMQRFAAEDFRGQRVSFRMTMRTVDAAGIGRIWIGARDQHRRLAFDNLGLDQRLIGGADGPLTGTTGWSRRSVTIDVPEASEYLQFGVLLGSGRGRLEACVPSFGPAAPDERPRPLPDAPRNLDLRTASILD